MSGPRLLVSPDMEADIKKWAVANRWEEVVVVVVVVQVHTYTLGQSRRVIPGVSNRVSRRCSS